MSIEAISGLNACIPRKENRDGVHSSGISHFRKLRDFSQSGGCLENQEYSGVESMRRCGSEIVSGDMLCSALV